MQIISPALSLSDSISDKPNLTVPKPPLPIIIFYLLFKPATDFSFIYSLLETSSNIYLSDSELILFIKA